MPEKQINSELLPVEDEIKNLLDMFEFFLTERHLVKPIETLGESVKDMRLIISRILIDHFMGLSTENEIEFCSALAEALASRAATLPFNEEEDRKYFDYCIGEILTGFEYAQEVKSIFPDDHVMQKILALDIPILRPFDYALRGKFKIVESKKKKSFYN